jgi:hypothetical protein
MLTGQDPDLARIAAYYHCGKAAAGMRECRGSANAGEWGKSKWRDR